MRAPPQAKEEPPVARTVEVVDVEPGAVRIAAWRNVVIVNWSQGGTRERVARLMAAMGTLAAKIEGLRSSVSIIQESAGLPTEDARADLVNMMSSNAARIACVAVVIRGSGFRTGAIRSLATNLRQQSRAAGVFQVFHSIDEASLWLPAEHTKRTGVAMTPVELRAALQEATRP